MSSIGDEGGIDSGSGTSEAVGGPFLLQLHPVRTDPSFDVGRLPVRQVSGTFWRQCSSSRDPLETPERALTRGRYHRKGQQARIYASSTSDVAWGELFRHVHGGLSPFEVKRRMAQLEVARLPVLDLTDAEVRLQLGVTEQELTGNRYRACQAIATLVRKRPDRFGGLLAPSPVRPTEQTLVIFKERVAHVRVVQTRVARAPRRLIVLFEGLVGTLPLPVQDEAMALLRRLRREFRRQLGR